MTPNGLQNLAEFVAGMEKLSEDTGIVIDGTAGLRWRYSSKKEDRVLPLEITFAGSDSGTAYRIHAPVIEAEILGETEETP